MVGGATKYMKGELQMLLTMLEWMEILLEQWESWWLEVVGNVGNSDSDGNSKIK